MGKIVLVRRVGLSLALGLIFVVAGWVWTVLDKPQSPGDLNFPRSGHTATLLPNGEVLVVGGNYVPSMTSPVVFSRMILVNRFLGGRFSEPITNYLSCEIYNPTTRRWRMAASLPKPRVFSTAVLLLNGKVLVSGGEGDDTACQLYDSTTNSWSPTGKIATPRCDCPVILLNNGDALVIGGEKYPLETETNYMTSLFRGIVPVFDLERYNPQSGFWKSESISLKHWGGAFVELSDGKVLIAGGTELVGTTMYKDCKIYDPTMHTLTPTGSLDFFDDPGTLTRLANGRVLLICNSGCEVYDPKAATWKKVAKPLVTDRIRIKTMLLKSGQVLVYKANGECELYNPVSDTWSSTGRLKIARWHNTMTLLNDGQVLVTSGGGDTELSASCELYNPATGTWSFP